MSTKAVSLTSLLDPIPLFMILHHQSFDAYNTNILLLSFQSSLFPVLTHHFENLVLF